MFFLFVVLFIGASMRISVKFQRVTPKLDKIKTKTGTIITRNGTIKTKNRTCSCSVIVLVRLLFSFINSDRKKRMQRRRRCALEITEIKENKNRTRTVF